MTEERAQRKLTAIFSADVKGYSRLMGDDELATVETLKRYREVMAQLIQQFRGRVIDSPGDNLLAEFASVVDAVECAVKVQEELKAKNAELREDRRMEFRIGVNLGDVIQDGETIYGDGVNIAARVEGLAEGGGICVSGTVYDSIGNKLKLGYDYLGEQTIKNIAKPVRIYRVQLEPEATTVAPGEKKIALRPWLRIATVVVVAILVAGALWYFFVRQRKPPMEIASVEKMAFPLPERPSIAVLPFANLSGDPEREYLTDGITENIITALSKTPKLFVIASNSTFAYKDKPVKVQQVAEELGVRYVLEGSVQTSGDQLRIMAQLIDAIKGHHLWAERYDRDLKDIFALQDEITLKICNALQMELTNGEQARMWHKGTKDLEAWGCIVKGNALFARMAKGDNAKARDLYERAVKIDPKDAFAWTMLAWTHWIDASLGYSESGAESFERAVELAKKALSMDDTLSDVYALLGGISLFQRQYEKAIAAGEKSIALGPNNATSHVLFGYSMTCVGRFEEAIALINKGMRLTPHYPAFYLHHLGRPYFQTGRYEEALATYKKLLERSQKGEYNPLPVHVNLAATYIMLGREEEARAHAAEVLRISPDFSLEWVRKASFYKDPAHLERGLDALRKAGLPEMPPLQLPEKPSIAVLPFTNISGDPEQDYFADGMADDLITDLSKISGLFVISRNSTFVYKGKAVRVKEVGRELGVQYVLEGSVRKAGDRVRINAQLIEATTGHHVWAERYDRELEDVFAVQDEVTTKIVEALAVKLVEGEEELVTYRETDSLEAYDLALRGWALFRRFSKEENTRARKLFEKALELDPEHGGAYAGLVWTKLTEWNQGWTQDPHVLDEALELAQKAVALDESMPEGHNLLGNVYLWRGQHDQAKAEFERAIALNPNNADALYSMGSVLVYSGKPEEAIGFLNKAMRLNPMYPAYYPFSLGQAYFHLERYDEAVSEMKRALIKNQDFFPANIYLAASYGHLGEEALAQTEVRKIIGHDLVSGDIAKPRIPYKDAKDWAHLSEGLRKAGLN